MYNKIRICADLKFRFNFYNIWHYFNATYLLDLLAPFDTDADKKIVLFHRSGLLIKRKTWQSSYGFSDTETIRIAQSSPWRESSSGVMIKTRRGGTIEGHDRSNAHPRGVDAVTAERIAEKPRSQLRWSQWNIASEIFKSGAARRGDARKINLGPCLGRVARFVRGWTGGIRLIADSRPNDAGMFSLRVV